MNNRKTKKKKNLKRNKLKQITHGNYVLAVRLFVCGHEIPNIHFKS